MSKKKGRQVFQEKNRGVTPSVAAPGVTHPSDATAYFSAIMPWLNFWHPSPLTHCGFETEWKFGNNETYISRADDSSSLWLRNFARHSSNFTRGYWSSAKFDLILVRTCSVERYWHCGDEIVHYRSNEMVDVLLFLMCKLQLRRL